tara:strand:- start:119 stop:391 length:273 start_codon:yes stop_codon:yes gene_type:complete
MIEEPKKIGNTELYTVRVLNMSVAKYYGVTKEYTEIVVQARELNKKELAKNKEKAELNLYYGVRYLLNKLVLRKLEDELDKEIEKLKGVK